MAERKSAQAAAISVIYYTERHKSATIIGCSGGLWPPDFNSKDRQPEAAATESGDADLWRRV